MQVRALPATTVILDWRLIRDGIGIALLVYAWWLTVSGPPQFDLMAYYTAWDGGLYDQAWHAPGSYVYPPPFAQLYAPLTLLPFPIFAALWMAGLAALLVWMFGFWWAGVLAALVGPIAVVLRLIFGSDVPFALMAGGIGTGVLVTGNVTILIAAGIVAGFRHPGAWSIPLLTKVTPGVGLAWFAVRREWRPLLVALGVTVGICAVSALISPAAWVEWVALMLNTDPAPLDRWVWIDWPLSVRLVLALGVVVIGASRGWRWTVFAAAFLSLPAVWMTSEVILLAALRSDDAVAEPGVVDQVPRRSRFGNVHLGRLVPGKRNADRL